MIWSILLLIIFAVQLNINKKVNTIMATQKDEIARLQAVAAQQDKISGEITGLKGEIQTLKDAAANQPNVSPELTAAIDAVVSRSQGLDDLNTDVPTEPPPAV